MAHSNYNLSFLFPRSPGFHRWTCKVGALLNISHNSGPQYEQLKLSHVSKSLNIDSCRFQTHTLPDHLMFTNILNTKIFSVILGYKYISSSELPKSVTMKSQASNSWIMFRNTVHCKSWGLKGELSNFKIRVRWLYFFTVTDLVRLDGTAVAYLDQYPCSGRVIPESTA